MVKPKLYFFSAGILESQKQYFTLNRGIGEKFDVPVPFFLLDHPKGKVLLDTGNSLKICRNPREHWGNAVDAYYPNMLESQYVVNQLAGLGIMPEEISHIVLSHLHLDHAGGISSFPNAKLIVQKAEYEWAFNPDNTQIGAYIMDDLVHNSPEQWQLITGDFDLFGDGCLCTFPTFGHTPGHQSYLVRLASGLNFILTSDACYTSENLRDNVPPGLVWNAELSQASMAKIQDTARQNNAHIVVGHDPLAWLIYRKTPDYYQ